MNRDPHNLFPSPTLAETILAVETFPRRQIPMQGYGPAQRVLAGIVAVALAIGAALPVGAAAEGASPPPACRLDMAGPALPAIPAAVSRGCAAAPR